MEQRVDVNCVKLQKSQSERLDMLKTVYGESPSQRSQGFKKSKDKTLLISSFDIKGIIQLEFALEGNCYSKILRGNDERLIKCRVARAMRDMEKWLIDYSPQRIIFASSISIIGKSNISAMNHPP
jgi:hypothetical protein